MFSTDCSASCEADRQKDANATFTFMRRSAKIREELRATTMLQRESNRATMLQSVSHLMKTKCLCVIVGLVASCAQMTFCHTRSETRCIASETTSRATRTCQHFSDPLLTVCFASFWVTRKWLFSFGNTASRASLTWGMLQSGLDEGMLQSGLDECSTWTCYRGAWTSASSGIFLLQITSWSTRPKKGSLPVCRRAPWTNRSGNGSSSAGKRYRKRGMTCGAVQSLFRKGMIAKGPTTR